MPKLAFTYTLMPKQSVILSYLPMCLPSYASNHLKMVFLSLNTLS